MRMNAFVPIRRVIPQRIRSTDGLSVFIRLGYEPQVTHGVFRVSLARNIELPTVDIDEVIDSATVPESQPALLDGQCNNEWPCDQREESKSDGSLLQCL